MSTYTCFVTKPVQVTSHNTENIY